MSTNPSDGTQRDQVLASVQQQLLYAVDRLERSRSEAGASQSPLPCQQHNFLTGNLQQSSIPSASLPVQVSVYLPVSLTTTCNIPWVTVKVCLEPKKFCRSKEK